MSVLSHLLLTATKTLLSDAEVVSIRTSISSLQRRLESHFGGIVESHFEFGSYTRGTILPRSIDATSDVDYMIVFRDTNKQPQTYLDRLRTFVEARYSKSEIYQSNPTIVLVLAHMKFELVPAIQVNGAFNIPAPSSGWSDWVQTFPNAFNQSLVEGNKRCGFSLKPAIRLVKYWNCLAGYPFRSFLLENKIVQSTWFKADVKECVLSAFESLQIEFYMAVVCWWFVYQL